MELKRISKYLSYILRHHPEEAGIELDKNGLAQTIGIIAAISKRNPIDIEILEEIVNTDKKGRYSFNEDMTKIRANQGHSINVDVELQRIVPPDELYHGTAEEFVESIQDQGLLPQGRLYVHLSKDISTALEVGKRHGKAIVYVIDTKQMHNDDYEFYLSKNGVFLTKEVPKEYLKVQDDITKEI